MGTGPGNLLMFLFLEQPAWQKYRQELGIQRTVGYLQEKGLPYWWPEQVPDPNESGTIFVPGGKPYNRSNCPHYEGYYLHGGCGGVSCRAAGEILPGIAWDAVCRNDFTKCPFYKEETCEKS